MYTDSLLYQLYARPDDAGQWTAVLNQLCRETGARSAVLQAVKRSGSRLTIAWSAADSYTLSRDAAPPAGIGDADNPRLEARRFARGLNRIARDEELFDRDDPAQHQLHAQLAQRQLGRFMGSLRQLRRPPRRDLPPGVQSQEVRHMAMPRRFPVEILPPFL